MNGAKIVSGGRPDRISIKCCQVCTIAIVAEKAASVEVSRGPKRNAAHNKHITMTYGSELRTSDLSQPPKRSSAIVMLMTTRKNSSTRRAFG